MKWSKYRTSWLKWWQIHIENKHQSMVFSCSIASRYHSTVFLCWGYQPCTEKFSLYTLTTSSLYFKFHLAPGNCQLWNIFPSVYYKEQVILDSFAYSLEYTFYDVEWSGIITKITRGLWLEELFLIAASATP